MSDWIDRVGARADAEELAEDDDATDQPPPQVSQKAQRLLDALVYDGSFQFAQRALSDYLGEIERDRERLDWIDRVGASVIPAWGGDGSRIGVVAQDPKGLTVRAGAVREAIDATRSQEDA